MRLHFSIFPILAALLAASAHAQPAMLLEAPAPTSAVASSAPPDPFAAIQLAPVPSEKPHLHLSDWAAIAGGATLRVLDYTTTERALSYPQYFHEDILPSALVHNKSGFAAFQAATVGVDIVAYRSLVHHNLRSVAVVAQYLYDSAMLFQVVSNYQTLGRVPLR
ncbi:MAG TPA: hypothetical protein VGG42_15790 [Acidobacteriaceae bacterium]